ncbi:putative 2-aminoethylphosphonate ABC transporter permease subunit [Sporosarcina sp. CAU 1771]
MKKKRKARQQIDKAGIIQRIVLVLFVVGLVIALVLPMLELISKAIHDRNEEFIGLSNFIEYFSTPSLVKSMFNTLFIASSTGIISVALAFFFAYAITRTRIKGKAFFRYMIFLPLFAPTMTYGIGLINLFGNKGIITTGFFGLFGSDFGLNINLYGPVGIIISEVLYTLPQAFLLLSLSLATTDYRLYEAADSLGAGTIKKIFTVTLPSIKYALFSAFIIAFILSFTDFGAPVVVGGQYNVMATDIYQQVVGQFNMSMGATVGLILIIPAVFAFVADRILQKKQGTVITAQSVPYKIKVNKMRDRFYFIYCGIVVGAIFLVMAAVLIPALSKYWPYDPSFTLDHFSFKRVSTGGIQPYLNSLWIALMTAIIGTIIVFLGAYMIEKSRFMRKTRQLGYFLSILPLALPGLAIGLAFIFFFNKTELSIPFTDIYFSNPLHFLYGTFWILILANIIHFFSVNFFTANTALKKLDKEFEPVSETMDVPFYKTFTRVTVPMSFAAIVEMFIYFFINSMTTISAVIFLYTSETQPASVAIVTMMDEGNTESAAAMSIIIILTNILVRVAYEFFTRKVRKKTEKWQSPDSGR